MSDKDVINNNALRVLNLIQDWMEAPAPATLSKEAVEDLVEAFFTKYPSVRRKKSS